MELLEERSTKFQAMVGHVIDAYMLQKE